MKDKEEFAPLHRLLSKMRGLKQTATAQQSIEWLESLVPAPLIETAGEAFRVLLDQLRHYNKWTGDVPCCRDEFFRNVYDIADEVELPWEAIGRGDGGGSKAGLGVLVTTPEHAAGVRRPFAAILGLREGEFPLVAGSSSHLSPALAPAQQERFNRLAGREIFSPAPGQVLCERRLFAACLRSPSRGLLLSTSAYSDGHETLPSPYWEDWRKRTEVEVTLVSRRAMDSPEWEDVWTPQQAAVALARTEAPRGPVSAASNHSGVLSEPEAIRAVSGLGNVPISSLARASFGSKKCATRKAMWPLLISVHCCMKR
jgi:hypothetical protein